MSILGNLVASWKKSRELQRISKVLGAPTPTEVNSLMERGDANELALTELIILVATTPTLRAVVDSRGAGPDDLKQIYKTLCSVGADQWSRGHWVPASTLVFIVPLDFILATTNNGSLVNYDRWIEVASRLMNYFESGSARKI